MQQFISFLYILLQALTISDIAILVFVLIVLISGGWVIWKFLKGGGDNW